MRTKSLLFAVLLLACSSRKEGDKAAPAPTTTGSGAGSAIAPPDERFDAGSLGALTFAVSEGSPAARAHFSRGLLALHSFWYDESTRQFQAAIDADPSMNIAYWGLAMSHLKLLWGEDNVAAAKAAIEKMPDPKRMTQRETAWVMATFVELLRGRTVNEGRKRFAAAMEQLHKQFPDDETATFLAIGILAASRPEDPDHLAQRRRAGELAASVFARNPRHPGAAHYLIHAYDTPELASLALPQAQAYAKIAPEAFHARHMPAHIFTRLGMWKEAIASCQSAWDASIATARRYKLSANHHDFHSLNWLVELNFELGHRKAADAALATFADAIKAGLGRQHRTLYAMQVSSYMMRTGEWTRVDELLAPLGAAPVEDPAAGGDRAGTPATHCAPTPSASPLAQIEEMTVLDARARAAAAQHDVARTTRHVEELEKLRETLKPFLQSSQTSEQLVTIEVAALRRKRALLARATRDDAALLTVLRESAADAEIETGAEKNPQGLMVREEIAETLLRTGKAKDAAAELAIVLQKNPGRARAILGAARAAKKLGDTAAAKQHYTQLLALWATADENTDGLAEAQAAVK